MTHATPAEIADAARYGRAMHADGRSRTPGRNLMDLIGDAPVGQPRTIEILRAFTDAYDALADAEADAFLASLTERP